MRTKKDRRMLRKANRCLEKWTRSRKSKTIIGRSLGSYAKDALKTLDVDYFKPRLQEIAEKEQILRAGSPTSPFRYYFQLFEFLTDEKNQERIAAADFPEKLHPMLK